MKTLVKNFSVIIVTLALFLSVLFGNNNVIALERTVDELIIYNQKPEVIEVTKVTKSEYPQFKHIIENTPNYAFSL